MKLLTKWAVERASETIKGKISERMQEWDRNHAGVKQELSMYEAVKLATSDPHWVKELPNRAKDREAYRDMRLTFEQLRTDSPKVRKASDAINQRNAEHDAKRKAESERLFRLRAELLDRAIIGNMTPEQLLLAVKSF